MDGLVWPTIADFLTEISSSKDAEGRDLTHLSSVFAEQEVHLLAELKGLKADDYQRNFGFKWGTGKFLENMVKRAVNRVVKNGKAMDRSGDNGKAAD